MSGGFLIVLLLLGTLSAHAKPIECVEDMKALLATLRTRPTDLKSINRVTVHGVEYEYRRLLGKGSSLVFETLDGKHVVKVYPKDKAGLALYEYWASQFLAEQGLPVAEVVSPTQTVERMSLGTEAHLERKGWPADNVIVIVKKHVAGLQVSELGQAARTGAIDADAARSQLVAMRWKIAPYFTSGKFRKWLQEKGVDPNQFGSAEKLVDEGDLKDENFLLTHRGWILIDP